MMQLHLCNASGFNMSLTGKSVFRYGLPFLGFMVLGSFLLREFASIRYEVYSYKKRFGKTKVYNEYNKSSNEDRDVISDEEEIKQLVHLGQNDEWKNIRGPRPWEDNREYNELMEKLKKKKAL